MWVGLFIERRNVIILVDFNQVCISNFMMQVGAHTNMTIEEDLIRHMVLNSIRMIRTKFKEKYGELVICSDSRRYWRRDVFPYYKANRKKDRAASDVDWPTLFDILTKLREELKENFPYKVIAVEGAEADDIIGTLTKHFHAVEPILIVSSDKDFMQLQKYKNVSQYSLIHKKFLRASEPEKFIIEHVLKGDRGDGIPNVLSDDDTFVMDKRQKALRQSTIRKILEADWPEDSTVFVENEKLLRNYHRNRQLIDLDFIPQAVEGNIRDQFDASEPKPRGKLLNYFVKHKLRNLTDSIGDF